MHKIGLIVVASLIVFGSVQAAEQGAVKRKDAAEPVATNARRDANGAKPASTQGSKGVATNAVISAGTTGTVALQSGVRAAGWSPFPPFASIGMIGTDARDEELEKLMEQVRERELRLLQNPEYRDLLRAQQRVSLHHSHSDLAALLQISKEQADQLLDLLAEQQLREQAAGRAMPSDRADPEAMQQYIQKVHERQRANEAEIAAVLGPQKFQEWKDYEQNAMARFQVQRLQQMLPPDARLQPDQRRLLVSAIGHEQRQLHEERARQIPDGVPDEAWQRRMQETQAKQMASMHQRLLDRTTSILSPTQLQQFESLLKQELDAISRQQFFFFGRSAPSADQ